MPVNKATTGICKTSISGSYIEDATMHRAIRSCFDLDQMADNRAHRQRPIDMREKRAAAGFLPDDAVAQIGQVHLGNDQAVLSRKMLIQGALQLIGRRQMNIAIGQIDWRAVKDAVGFKLRPLRGGEYFEGGIRMAVFGHRPPMPKSGDVGKPRIGSPPACLLCRHVFDHHRDLIQDRKPLFLQRLCPVVGCRFNPAVDPVNFAVHIMILRRKLAEMFIAHFQRVQGVGGVGEFGMEIMGGMRHGYGSFSNGITVAWAKWARRALRQIKDCRVAQRLAPQLRARL